MSWCTPFINQTITEEVSWFQGGNHQDWRGVQISFVLCPRVFFYDEHTTCKSPCSNLALFRVHLPYLGDYVHFLGINAHNSSSNNRCMKGSTRTAWKTMLVPFSKFSCLLQERADISMKCVAIVNHKCLFIGFSTIEKWNKCLKTWRLAWFHGMTSPCPGKNLRRFGLCRHARPS